MRNRNKAFLSCAILAGVLLAATGALAQTPLPIKCTTVGTGQWQVSVVQGPCPVTSGDPSACAASGDYTGIQYQISSSADHVATVATANNTVSGLSGNQVYGACAGDPITGLGKYSCHEKAMKVNPDALTRKFWVVVSGNKLPVLQSVAAKKGSKTEACAIVGLGEDAPVGPDACVPGCGNFNPDQTLKRIETIVFKGCAVRFEFDLNTGEVTSASNDPSESPNPNCSALIVSDAADLEITLTGYGTLGKGKFGDGTIATGSTSCTTRVIGGKVYTWGDPCP